MPARSKEMIVGREFINTRGEVAKIVEYNSSLDVVVQFENGELGNFQTAALKMGYFRNPSIPSVFDIGFPGGHIPLSDKCTYYSCWRSMLERCYTDRRNKCYVGCTVDPLWHNYQNFRQWYIAASEGKSGKLEIDKDLVVPNNKIYGPDFCELIPREMNQSLKKGNPVNKTAGCNTGVYLEKGKYRAIISKLNIGTFSTNKEAFAEYCKHKTALIRNLAEKYRDVLSERAYTAASNYNFKNYEEEV